MIDDDWFDIAPPRHWRHKHYLARSRYPSISSEAIKAWFGPPEVYFARPSRRARYAVLRKVRRDLFGEPYYARPSRYRIAIPEYKSTPLTFDLLTFQEICPKGYDKEVFVSYDFDAGTATVTPCDRDTFAKFEDRAMKANP